VSTSPARGFIRLAGKVATLLAAMEDRRSLVLTLKTLRFDASRAVFEEVRERYACEVGPGQAAMSCSLSP